MDRSRKGREDEDGKMIESGLAWSGGKRDGYWERRKDSRKVWGEGRKEGELAVKEGRMAIERRKEGRKDEIWLGGKESWN